MDQPQLFLSYVGAAITLIITLLWFIQDQDYEPLIAVVAAVLGIVVFISLPRWLDLGLSLLLIPFTIIALWLVRSRRRSSAATGQTPAIPPGNVGAAVVIGLAYLILFSGMAWFLQAPSFERFAVLLAGSIAFAAMLHARRSLSAPVAIILFGFLVLAPLSLIKPNTVVQSILSELDTAPEPREIASSSPASPVPSPVPDSVNPPGDLRDHPRQAASPTALSSETEPSTQVHRILVDTRHGYASDFQVLARTFVENFDFEESGKSEFSLDALSSYDAVIIPYSPVSDPSWPKVEPFTQSEIDAVRAYVNQGGSVFLIGTGWVWTAYNKPQTINDYPLNRIAEGYGIFFDENSDCERNADNVIGISESSMKTQHPITSGVQFIASGEGASAGTLRVAEPADAIIFCGKASPILAAVEANGGKLVALNYPDFVLKNVNSEKYDNYELLRNVLTWLVAD